MKEITLSNKLTIIELYRNNCYDYYIEHVDNANLYYCFGVENAFSTSEIINLYTDGYFDSIIADIDIC